MLRTLIAGALAAFVGARLKKAYDEGKFDDVKERIKAGAERAQAKAEESVAEFRENRLSPTSPAPAPAASRRARLSPPDDPSRPSKAAPWPADTRAVPKPS